MFENAPLIAADGRDTEDNVAPTEGGEGVKANPAHRCIQVCCLSLQ